MDAKTKLRLSLIFLLAVGQLFAGPKIETGAQDVSHEAHAKHSPAQWITSPGAPIRDLTMLHFRKELELEKVPEHFLVDVSADNRFLLEVNQERIGSGPARGDLAHWRYEVYDLAPHLHCGKKRAGGNRLEFGNAGTCRADQQPNWLLASRRGRD